MIESVGIRAKTYAYLMDDDNGHEKTKRTKNCVIKRRLMFKNSIDCLLNNRIILQSQERLKNDHDNVYAEQINKIALSSNDAKRLQTFDKITMYPCESEMLSNI